ncbi:hypothetical protein LFL96_27775 [Paraburkholderia sp. D15]|uniref:hypothetical protein n=1 Tax=Paraburkholderia sp. D15 TaxID=2880218 RepID=UPI00247AA05A|nr:hypothetical protein [Paraburkholderia sp. D15]WGS52009.1 hypothetical protein LFL96_27775 [Paraburkholderia sp. D15]
MNTRIREASATHLRVGAAATCCVALACAAAVYIALDPVTTARANLDACVRDRLAARGNAAASAKSGAVTAQDVSHETHDQALSAAIDACSNQP